MNSGPHTQYCRTWCRSWASKLPSTRRADTTTKPIVIATRPARSISHVSPLGVRSKRMRPARTDGRWNVRSPARRPSSVFGDVQMNPSQTGTDCTVARSAPTILVPVMADPSSGAALDVPELAIELGARFADAGHELYLVGGSVRDLLLGRPSVLRGRALRHRGGVEGRSAPGDHDVPPGGLRRATPEAGGHLWEGHRDRSGTTRLHDQRHGGPASRRRAHRPVRWREGVGGASPRHADGSGD